MSRKKHVKVNKFIRFGFAALIFVLLLSVGFNYLSDMTYAIEVQDNGYGLQVSSEKIEGIQDNGELFKIDNMAPGEEYNEAVTLKNAGSDSFQSYITAINTSAQENLLFDSLDFIIRDESEDGVVIFNGKLKDMKNIALCSLSRGYGKTYYMTLSLPAGSGNEYQSRTAGFKFIITAEGNMTEQ